MLIKNLFFLFFKSLVVNFSFLKLNENDLF